MSRDLHDLMGRFQELGVLEDIARGPKHPESPRPALAPQIAAWLEQHPCLRRDPGYVDYLEQYSGAWIDTNIPAIQVDIFGFDDGGTSTHLVHGDGDAIDREGMMPFAAVNFQVGPDLAPADGSTPGSEPRSMVFGFDTTGTRPWGVYRHDAAWEWYCDTFLEWLERLVERGGLPADGLDLSARRAKR